MKTLKKKLISVMLIFTLIWTVFMPLVSTKVYAEPDTRTEITRINLHATSGTTVAEYGATITQPVVEIVSSDPTGAVSYLSLNGIANWFKNGEYVAPGNTFGEGNYYLQIRIDLSGTGQGLYKWADDTKIMYLDGTRLSNSGVGDSYLINQLSFNLESPSGTAPTITTTSLSAGNIGDEYSATLTATGTKPITWSLKSGSSLPSGLNLTSNGVISGTPTVSGDYDFTVVATNSAGSVEKNLSLKIKNLQKITRINLHATSGTTVAEYGATITQPVVEIVSSDPTGAVSYLSLNGIANWFKNGEYVAPGNTFEEGEYYLQIKIDLSGTGQGLYKWADDTKIMYLDGTRLSNSGVGDSYLINELEYTVSSTATTHKVTFNSNGGSAVAQQNVVHGGTITEPTNPTKNGYAFAGWYSDSELTIPFDFSTAINNTTRLYAKWNLAHNVTFNLDDGTWTDAGTNPQVVNDGNTAIRPSDPTKAGCTFGGWFLDSGCTTPFSFTTAITEDRTIYAKWNTITNAVNAILSPIPTAGLTIGDLTIEPEESDKYTLSSHYWKLNDSGSALTWGTTIEAGQTYTLYLTFSPTGSYDIPDDATFTVNGLPTDWTEFESKTNRKISFTVPVAVTTYNVTFDLDGGEWTDVGTNPQVVNEGEKVTKPTDPTKDGYIFAGWYIDAGFTNSFDFDNVTISDNTTIYARWNEIINPISAIVTLPTAGSHPVETGTAGDSSYTIRNVHFYDGSTQLTTSDTFEAGKTYRIYVIFKPNTGKAIETTATATINGENATYWGTLADGFSSKMFYIDYTVPAIGTHTVTFDLDGGTWTDTGTNLQVVNEGDKVTKPTDPTKDGKIFFGWYNDAGFTTPFDFANTTITTDKTIYAQFVDQSIYIYYSAGEGTGGTVFSAMILAGNSYNVKTYESLTTFSAPEGKHFAGWNYSEGDPITKAQLEVNPSIMVNKVGNDLTRNITFTAYYEDDESVAPLTIEGDNQTFTLGDTKDIVITCSGALGELTAIKVNDVELDSANRELASGSTVLTLKNAYLNTLSKGTYKITFEYGAKSKDATLNVVEATTPGDDNGTAGDDTNGNGETNQDINTNGENGTDTNTNDGKNAEERISNSPKTGDNVVIYIIGFVVSTICLVGCTIYFKKR